MSEEEDGRKVTLTMVMVVTIPTAVKLVAVNSDPEDGNTGANGGDGDVHETDRDDGDSGHVIMISDIMRLL